MRERFGLMSRKIAEEQFTLERFTENITKAFEGAYSGKPVGMPSIRGRLGTVMKRKGIGA